MKQTKMRARLCLTLLVLNILFIWGNSLLPGSMSAALSRWVQYLLEQLFSIESGGAGEGHGLLRKLAHLTEFACLGVLFTWLYAMVKKPLWLALISGFLVAGTDETIQYFIPGRGPSLIDVMIDTAGVAVGMTILLVGYAQYKRKKHNLEETIL